MSFFQSKIRMIWLIITCFSSVLRQAELFGEAQYQLINLGLLDNSVTSVATSINNQGQVCGFYKTGKQSIFESKNFVFIWDPTKGLNSTTLKSSSLPIINNNGNIFGSYYCLVSSRYSDTESVIQEYIFKWQNPLNYLTLFNVKNLYFPREQESDPYLSKRSVVWDVNDNEEILISNQAEDNLQKSFIPFFSEPEYKLWVYSNGNFLKIEEPSFIGLKINNRSQILGYFYTDNNDVFKQKKFQVAIYDISNKTFQLLGFSEDSLGTDMNDNGEVVGFFYDPFSSCVRGFFAYSMHDITYIDNFMPKAMNNKGKVVGEFISGEKKGFPAIWENGELFDLTDIVRLKDHLGCYWDSLNKLLDINDDGHIVGYGKYQGNIHGFLLVPVDFQ